MRAVKDGLPAPSGESEETEGPRWTRAVEDQSAPIPEEITSKLGGIIYMDYGRPMRALKASLAASLGEMRTEKAFVGQADGRNRLCTRAIAT